MSSIRITSVPAGDAPYWVRKEWVGVEISIISEESLTPVASKVVGVLGGKPSPENQGGYAVSVDTALRALERKSQSAANWFRENLNPTASRFVFGEKFCEYLP